MAEGDLHSRIALLEKIHNPQRPNTFGAEMAQRAAAVDALRKQKRDAADAEAIPRFVEMVKAKIRDFITLAENDPERQIEWVIEIANFSGLNDRQRSLALELLTKEGLKVSPDHYDGKPFWVIRWN